MIDSIGLLNVRKNANHNWYVKQLNMASWKWISWGKISSPISARHHRDGFWIEFGGYTFHSFLCSVLPGWFNGCFDWQYVIQCECGIYEIECLFKWWKFCTKKYIPNTPLRSTAVTGKFLPLVGLTSQLACAWHGLLAHESSRWQSSPVLLGGHSHINVPTLSWQVAPCL